MDNKKYEGSLSFDDFAEGLVTYGNCKSFGEVWEKCVTCPRCEHQKACAELIDKYYNINCRQVIDVLLGHLKLEDIIKGEN